MHSNRVIHMLQELKLKELQTVWQLFEQFIESPGIAEFWPAAIPVGARVRAALEELASIIRAGA